MRFETPRFAYAAATLSLLLVSATSAKADACKTLFDEDEKMTYAHAVSDVKDLAGAVGNLFTADGKETCERQRRFARHIAQLRDRRIKLERNCERRITQKCNSACWEKHYKEAAKVADEACAPPKPRAVLSPTDMKKCDAFDAQAVEACDRVIKAGKESRENISQAYMNRATINGMTNPGGDSVIADLSKAIEFRPAASNLYFARGQEYQKRKDYARAVGDYTKSMSLKDDAVVRSSRANAYFDWGKTAEALAEINEAIRLYSSDVTEFAQLLERRGDMFASLRRKAEALADYRHYLALGPQFDKAGLKEQFVLMSTSMKGKIEWVQNH